MQEAGMGAGRTGYGRGGGVARTYALIFGLVYALVALLELLIARNGGWPEGDSPILQFEPLQNVVHWAIAVVVLGSYFAGENAARMVARVVGIVLLALAVWGFIAPDSLGELLGYDGDIPAAYNWVHLVSGLVATFVGFFAGRAYASRPATA